MELHARMSTITEYNAVESKSFIFIARKLLYFHVSNSITCRVMFYSCGLSSYLNLFSVSKLCNSILLCFVLFRCHFSCDTALFMYLLHFHSFCVNVCLTVRCLSLNTHKLLVTVITIFQQQIEADRPHVFM